MGHVVLKGKGDINEVSELLMDEMVSLTSNHSHKIHRRIGSTEFILLIFEKHFMRNSSRATLTVAIHQDLDECVIDAVGSGGGSGLIFNFSWGANADFAYQVADILKPKGFQVLSEEGA